MSNLKNVTNRLRTAVGLAPTTISADDDMTSPMNLGQSLLSSRENETGGSYTALNTREPEPVHVNYDNLSLNEEERLRKQEEQILKEIRARKLIEEEDRKLAERLQGDGDDAVMLKIQVPRNLYGGQIIKVQIPGHGVKSVQIPLGLQPGDSFMITTSKFHSAGDGAVRVKVPDDVAVGDTFLAILPDGNRVSVTVPPGVKTGDELLLPARGGNTSAQVQRNRIRLSDREVVAAMTQEEKEFLNALPEEMHRDAIQEKREALIRELESGGGATAAPASAPPPSRNRTDQSKWVAMVQATIPEGVETGDKFKMIMPDGRPVMVEVPPGMQPGDSIGVPANAGLEVEEETTPTETKPPLTEEKIREREEFLAALPPDIRAEVLANEAENANTNVNSPGETMNTEGNTLEIETDQQQQQQVPPTDSPLIDFAALGSSTTTTIDDGGNSSGAIDSLNFVTPGENVNIDSLDGDHNIPTPSVFSTGFSAAPAAQTLQPNLANQFDQDHSSGGVSMPPVHNPYFDVQQQQEQQQTQPPSYENAVGTAPVVSNPFDMATSIPNTAMAPPNPPVIATAADTPNTDAFASLSIHEQVPKSPPKSQHNSAIREAPPRTPLEKLREAKAAFEKGEIDQLEFNRIKQEVIRAL